VLALVQGLTACAQLLPPQQMERLEKAYPSAEIPAVGCSVCSSLSSSLSAQRAPTHQPDLYEAAKSRRRASRRD